MKTNGTGILAAVLLSVCIAAGVAGCSKYIPIVGQVAQQTQAVAGPNNPAGPVATQPAVIYGRPIVQAVGQATGPAGETILSLIAGVAGLLFAGVSQYQKAITQQKHLAAVAELSKVVPSSVILTPATQRVVAKTAV